MINNFLTYIAMACGIKKGKMTPKKKLGTMKPKKASAKRGTMKPKNKKGTMKKK